MWVTFSVHCGIITSVLETGFINSWNDLKSNKATITYKRDLQDSVGRNVFPYNSWASHKWDLTDSSSVCSNRRLGSRIRSNCLVGQCRRARIWTRLERFVRWRMCRRRFFGCCCWPRSSARAHGVGRKLAGRDIECRFWRHPTYASEYCHRNCARPMPAGCSTGSNTFRTTND